MNKNTILTKDNINIVIMKRFLNFKMIIFLLNSLILNFNKYK
jgi:hypothetical protein